MASKQSSLRSILADDLRQGIFRPLLLLLQYVMLASGLLLYFRGYSVENYNTALSGIMGLLVSNVIYGCLRPRHRVIFLTFHVPLFTFLLSRPFISYLRGEMWWYASARCELYALKALMLTLVFLRVGAVLGEWILERRLAAPVRPHIRQTEERGEVFRNALQRTSLLLFAVALGVNILLSRELLLFMRGREYTEYYTSFQSQYPFYIQTLGSMLKYALCIFLATLPRKRMAFVPLALYLLSTIPLLLVGPRNPFVLAALFILLYYLLRDILGGKDRWMGRLEWTAVIIALPFALAFLSAYVFAHSEQPSLSNIGPSIVNFFYKQGVSYEVLTRGYAAIPDLPAVIPKNYTFGPFTDYFLHGTIAQKLFHAVDLGNQNSELLAVYGHSFAHSMSYVAHPDYLAGRGWGSSYLLELFVDWGYWGIAIGSLLLGMVLVLMLLTIRRGILLRTITLVSLTTVFFLPRDSAMGWLLFTVTIQFWAAVIACYGSAAVLSKLYFAGKTHPKNHLAFLAHPLWDKSDPPASHV